MPMPTIPGVPPETWEQLLQILAQLNTSLVELGEQGITTYGALVEWMDAQGYAPVYIQTEQFVGWAKTTAADPATSNAVANRVATDIVATGGAGSAVSQFVTGGNRTLGLVAKGVAVGACLSLLISTIGVGIVSDEIKEDLITSADPYTIDGENVPVLIDENGKTHFLEEMVEAIRAKAIELGIFDSGDMPAGFQFSYEYNGTVVNVTAQNAYISLTRSIMNSVSTDPTIFNYYTSSRYRRMYKNFGSVNHVSVKNFWAYGSQYGFGGAYVIDPPIASGEYYYFYYDYVSSGTVSERYDTASVITVNFNGETHQIYYTAWGLGVPTNLEATGTTGHYATNQFYNPYVDAMYAETDSNRLLASYICTNEMGGFSGGIEGITPAQDLITAGVADTSIPLTQVLPQLAQGEMSIASPTENDLTHKSNWYPVSINSEDVFTDGATEEETSTATEGDVKQDLQPSILDAIQELIEQFNPDGVPDIPVSDSGDTPPENPPLTPSSGTNGSNGLWAIYNPTLAQVQQFGAWLWSDTLADQFKRIFNSPIDGVIGFHMLYCTPSRGADQTIKCGFLDSSVTSRTVSSPYVEIDCGTVNIGEYYRNALDYDYTRISVYLPFIGIVPLDTNIVMGSSLNVTYRVDVLTGTCLAQIKVIKENSDAVMYAFEGNCAVQIPLTATTYTGMVGALMSGVSAGIGVMTGNIAQAVTSGVNALANMYSGKSGVKQSGTMGANAGALGIRKPYVIITHPIEYMPVNFNKLEGLPSNITATLGTLTGFTRVRSVHLENIGTATQEEINMIEELLKEGVII